MGKIIGIDLGTTNSAVAIYEGDQARVYTNSNGGRTTPSVVALKKTRDKKTKETSAQWIVGAGARNQAAANPALTFSGVKRLIGRRFDDPEVAKMKELASYKIVPGPNGDAWLDVDGKPTAPEEISAKILRDLKKAVEDQLGAEVTQAVITVPAYFNDMQRQATRNAGAIAGLEVMRIVNEPTAAALAYGLDKKEGGKIAVYDLGGGTFDVSILEVVSDAETGTSVQVLSTNGDTFLGGENFDERIAEYLLKTLEEDDNMDPAKVTPEVRSRLREAAEKAKVELSTQDVATISLPFLVADAEGGMINFETSLSRAKLESLLKDFIDRTVDPCRKALADAGLKASDLDEVILVGGQTRMPLVVKTVKDFFGKEPRRDVNPDEIVAMGAGVQGAVLEGKLDNVVLLDVIPLSICIRTAGGVATPLIARNTAIPAEYSDVFSTAADNQRDVEIQIVQGERPMAEENKLLGRFMLDGIPPAKKGAPQIEVTLSIDANGVLSVAAKDQKTGRAQKITVKANGGLSDTEVEKMLKDAESHAEQDRITRDTVVAKGVADDELKQAKTDVTEEWFTGAPDEALKQAFRDAAESLSQARAGKDLAALVEKTETLRDLRLRVSESFSAAAAPSAEEEAPKSAPASTPRPPSL